MANDKTQARSDDSHDGRYTHPVQNLAAHQDPTLPQMLYGKPYVKGGTVVQDTRVVNTNEEREDALKSGSWKAIRTDWTQPKTGAQGFARVAVLVLVALLSLVGLTASAQTLANHPTLAAAITTTSQNTVQVSSASNIAVGDCMFADTELMQVNVIPASGAPAVVGITRGWGGTRSQLHFSGAQTLTGSCGAYFHVVPPLTGYSSCTRSAQLYIPWVDTTTGNIWVCESGGSWQVTNARPTVNGNSFQFSQMFPPLDNGPSGPPTSEFLFAVTCLLGVFLGARRIARRQLQPQSA